MMKLRVPGKIIEVYRAMGNNKSTSNVSGIHFAADRKTLYWAVYTPQVGYALLPVQLNTALDEQVPDHFWGKSIYLSSKWLNVNIFDWSPVWWLLTENDRYVFRGNAFTELSTVGLTVTYPEYDWITSLLESEKTVFDNKSQSPAPFSGAEVFPVLNLSPASRELFSSYFDKAVLYAAHDNRPMLTTVQVAANADGTRDMVAADGHRLYMKNFAGDTFEFLTADQLTLPHTLGRLLTCFDDVSLGYMPIMYTRRIYESGRSNPYGWESGKFTLGTGTVKYLQLSDPRSGMKVWLDTPDGRYADYKGVLPKSLKHLATLSSEQLEQATPIVLGLKPYMYYNVGFQMSFQHGSILFRAKSQEYGQTEVAFPCSADMTPGSVAVNFSFMEYLLKEFAGVSGVVISTEDVPVGESPLHMHFQDSQDSSVTLIIMPMSK